MAKAFNARNEILAKLKVGRNNHVVKTPLNVDWESNVFPVPTDLLATFKAELETIAGHVIIGNSEFELVEALKAFLSARNIQSVYCLDGELAEVLGPHLVLESREEAFVDMQAAATRCESLVARTGSVVISSAHASGRRLNVFAPVHIVWANASQLVPFVDDALAVMQQRYSNGLPSQISVVTGASRTADIEKTLVMGAHGPKELLVLVNSQL